MDFKPDYSSDLTLDNTEYKSYVLSMFKLMLEADIFKCNSSNIFAESIHAAATVTAKSSGMMACRSEFEFMFSEFTTVVCDFSFLDGEQFESGDVICSIRGEASEILSVERVLLNLLSRSCGIALKASEYLSSLNCSEVLMTRKCLLGMFDKKAGSIGGALTHRLNLDDALMFKDNHHSIFNLNDLVVPDSVKFIDVEVDSIGCLEKVLRFYSMRTLDIPKIIMLDNFSVEEVSAILDEFDFEGLFVEVSGGINLTNISGYDKKGVSFISTSDIARNPYAVDLSLNFDKK